MLKLSRRVGERIFVAPHMWITVLAVRGSRTTLGFQAPEGTDIKLVPSQPVDSANGTKRVNGCGRFRQRRF
jgi:hypothetical protein